LLVFLGQKLSANQPVQPTFLEFSAQGPCTAGGCLLVQKIRVMAKKKTLGCQIDSPYF
jgi:hypothetical protein